MFRPRPQFRLSTLLWITLAVACWFGGAEWQHRQEPKFEMRSVRGPYSNHWEWVKISGAENLPAFDDPQPPRLILRGGDEYFAPSPEFDLARERELMAVGGGQKQGHFGGLKKATGPVAGCNALRHARGPSSGWRFDSRRWTMRFGLPTLGFCGFGRQTRLAARDGVDDKGKRGGLDRIGASKPTPVLLGTRIQCNRHSVGARAGACKYLRLAQRPCHQPPFVSRALPAGNEPRAAHRKSTRVARRQPKGTATLRPARIHTCQLHERSRAK